MDLGRSYSDLRLFVEAMDRYKQACKLLRCKVRGNHPYTVDLLMQMGETESARQNHDEAMKLMRDALTIASDLGLGDLSRAPILYEIGMTLLLKGETTQGMDYIHKALGVSRRVNGCQLLHFFIATLIGKLKYDEGHFQHAAESLQDAVDAARETKYEGDAYVEALAYLCVAYKSQGMHEKASATYSSFLQSLKRCDSSYVHANSTVQLLRIPTCELKFNMSSTSSPEFVQEPPKATFCCCRYSSFRRWHRNCGEVQPVTFPSSRPQTRGNMKLTLPRTPRSPSLFLAMQPLSNDVPSYCYLDSATSAGRTRLNSDSSWSPTLSDHEEPRGDYRSHHTSSHPIAAFTKLLLRWSSSPAGVVQTNNGAVGVRRCQSLTSVFHHSDDDRTSRLNSNESRGSDVSDCSDSALSRERIDSLTSSCEKPPSGSLDAESCHARRLSQTGQDMLSSYRQKMAFSEPAPSHTTDTIDATQSESD